MSIGRPVCLRIVSPNWLTSGGRFGCGLRHAVLNVHLVDVGLRVDVERHGQRHRAVVRVGRLHVEHVVDAVHLLLERRRDGLLDRQGVSARVLRRDDDLWRHDLRELSDRQTAQGHHATEHGDDGDDNSDDRDAG